MISELMQDLRNYFSKIENPSEEEEHLLTQLNSGYFPITSVHRNDLLFKGYDIDEISDSDMYKLANKMANDYCEQLFWDSMDIIASECLNLPKAKQL